MPRFLAIVLSLILALPASATTYYLSPTGSDSNNGLSPALPWATPNHAVNCGDVLVALPGTYAEGNFRLGNWGVSTCPSANNVAWVACQTAFSCGETISVAGHDAFGISQSFWGVQGWVITVSTPSTNQCFNAFPPNNSTEISHIIFANNIANGCGDGAFTSGQATSTIGVDYIAIIGNIAYNGAQDNANCYSGIDIVPAINSDTNPGTHILIAGNFAWGNVDPNPCGGVTPTDGHGLSLDSLSNGPYTGQILLDNNISVFNGATGFQNFSSTKAPVYIRHNTFFGNQTGSTNANPCGEFNANTATLNQASLNLIVAGTNTCSGSVAEFALASSADDATNIFYSNYLYSAAGHNTNVGSAQLRSNTTGTNPSLSNPVQPSAPNCSGFATVPACMATVIANFTPTTQAAKAYGYQTPSAIKVWDPLFPQWLCGVTNLPAGLITMGCLTRNGSTLSGGATAAPGVTVH